MQERIAEITKEHIVFRDVVVEINLNVGEEDSDNEQF